MKTLLRLSALVCALACVSPAFGQAAAPIISPAAGTYASTQSVTVTDATSGADIFCTTDGSTPTPESPLYTGPVTVSANTTVKCTAAVAGVRRNNIQNDSPSASGTYWKAADYWDAGGSGTPTGVVHQSGIASPSLSGASMEFAFTGQTGKQTNVLFAVTGGFGKCDSCTYHKYDYYVYDDPVTCSANATDEQDDYNFMASLGLRNMDGGQARRTSSGGNPPGWDFGGNNNVHWTYSGAAFTLSCGAWHHIQRAEHIVPAEFTSKPCVDYNGVHWACIYQDYWTLDGTRYTNSGAPWTFPMNALPGGWSSVNGIQHQGDVSSAGGTWKEYIDNANFVSYYPASAVTSATYTITGGTGTPTAATPAIAPAGGTVSGTQTVTMTDTTSGAAIHYTTDGSAPTCSSATYSAPLSVTTTTTVKAIACASGYLNSAVASQVYSYSGSGGITPAPSLSPAGGSYTSTQYVSMSDTQSGAVIYFTTDGSAPTTSSATYSVPLAVTATATLKAMAVASGLTNSPVVTQTYTIVTTATLPTPTFSPIAGNYPGAQTVTITCAAGATCYYTTDGSTPTTSSTVYSAPISVTSTLTLKAIAVETGYNNSAVGVAAYTIGCGLTPYATGNIDPTQLKATGRQGAGLLVQMAYGGYVNADLPIFNCNGDLVDGGIGIPSFATKAGVQQQSYTYAPDTGAANAYAVALSPAPTLMAGSVVRFKAANANTGASTLAVNGGSAIAIKKSGSTALSGGEISTGQITEVVYDGTNWQLIGGASSGGSSPLTTKGDLYGFNTAAARIPVGPDSDVLMADSTQPLGVKWAANPAGFANPMTTLGDFIVGGTGGTAARLPVGSDGQVIMADHTQTNGVKWATPSGGGSGALVLLEEHTASASTEIDFTTRNVTGQSGASFQSDFDTYRIEYLNLVPSAANLLIAMQVTTNGGSSWDTGTNYGWIDVRFVPSGSQGTRGGNSGKNFICLVACDATLATNVFGASGTVTVYSPRATTGIMATIGQGTYIDTEPYIFTHIQSGQYLATSAVNGFRIFLTTTGTLTGNVASGTMRLYGVAK